MNKIKKVKCIYLFLFIIMINTNVNGSDSLYIYPSASEVKVKVVNSIIKLDEGYRYIYSVKSLHESIQDIWFFNIENNAKIYPNQSPKDWWSGYRNKQVNILPVWAWSTAKNMIKPGTTLNGFSFRSFGLPTILKYFIEGYVEPPVFEDEPTADELVGATFVENSAQGYTISPSNPPNPFIPLEFIDTLINYTESSYSLGWINDEQTSDKYNNYFNNAKTYLNQNNNATNAELQKVLTDCNTDSSSVLTSEAYALLYFNTEYLITQLPESEPGLLVKLTDSQGNLLTGGTLQYYEGAWKDAIDNGDGTYVVQTDRSTISLKMNYLGGWQQFNNVPSVDGSDTVVFQTVKAVVQLNDSQGNLHDGGAASFYAKSWQEIGTTVNGETSIELLPKEYSFRMSYLGGSIDKKQNIGEDSLVVFQTVDAVVQLKDSQGNLLDGGTAQFYAKSWQEIGITVNGEVTKELLPKEYSFRMAYNNIGNDKKQNIADNVVVVFSTIPVTVSVKDGNGDIILGAEVQYYSKQWNVIGNTDSSGEITTEMLPKNITFRVKYNSQTTDKQQNTAENSLVEFIVE